MQPFLHFSYWVIDLPDPYVLPTADVEKHTAKLFKNFTFKQFSSDNITPAININ